MRFTSIFALTTLVVSVFSTSPLDLKNDLLALRLNVLEVLRTVLDEWLRDKTLSDLLELLLPEPPEQTGAMAFRTEALNIRKLIDQITLDMKSLSSPLSKSDAQWVIGSLEDMITIIRGLDVIRTKDHTLFDPARLGFFCSAAQDELSRLKLSLTQLQNQLVISSPQLFAQQIGALTKDVDALFDYAFCK